MSNNAWPINTLLFIITCLSSSFLLEDWFVSLLFKNGLTVFIKTSWFILFYCSLSASLSISVQRENENTLRFKSFSHMRNWFLLWLEWIECQVLFYCQVAVENKRKREDGSNSEYGFHWKMKSRECYLSSPGSRQHKSVLEVFSLAFRHQLALGMELQIQCFHFRSSCINCGCLFSDKIILGLNWRLMKLVMKNYQLHVRWISLSGRKVREQKLLMSWSRLLLV